MSDQFTGGEWKANGRLVSAEGRIIANTVADADGKHAPTEEEAIANARLMAAAPELLQFARIALAFAESAGDQYGAELARAVIVKARTVE